MASYNKEIKDPWEILEVPIVLNLSHTNDAENNGKQSDPSSKISKKVKKTNESENHIVTNSCSSNYFILLKLAEYKKYNR